MSYSVLEQKKGWIERLKWLIEFCNTYRQSLNYERKIYFLLGLEEFLGEIKDAGYNYYSSTNHLPLKEGDPGFDSKIEILEFYAGDVKMEFENYLNWICETRTNENILFHPKAIHSPPVMSIRIPPGKDRAEITYLGRRVDLHYNDETKRWIRPYLRTIWNKRLKMIEGQSSFDKIEKNNLIRLLKKLENPKWPQYSYQYYHPVLSELANETHLFNLYMLIAAIPLKWIQKCKGCKKFFLNFTDVKKLYCNFVCASRSIAKAKREELKKDPEKWKAYHDKQAEYGKKRYRRIRIMQFGPNVKIGRRILKKKEG